MKTSNSLMNLFNTELHSSLKEVIVTSDKKGYYTLFSRYLIRTISTELFTVIDSYTKESTQFITLRHAIAWCTLHNSKKWIEARRIQSLDLKLSSLSVDIAIHRRMLKLVPNSDSKMIFLTKLQEDSYKRKQLLAEINAFINVSKMIQDKKFTQAKERKIKYN